MTSQKGGFIVFSKEQQNHDSENWTTEQSSPHSSPCYMSTLYAINMYV